MSCDGELSHPLPKPGGRKEIITQHYPPSSCRVHSIINRDVAAGAVRTKEEWKCTILLLVMPYATVNLITHPNDVKVTKFVIYHGVGKRRGGWWDEGLTAAFT